MEQRIARIGIVSLGCPKNMVDSEVLLGRIGAEGYVIVADPHDADLVMVNTCGFLQAAREESLGVLRELAALKGKGRIRGILVVGCMAELYREKLRREVPEIDGVLGLNRYGEIGAAIGRILSGGEPFVWPGEQIPTFEAEVGRLRLTPRHYAYLRIAEGCDHTCSFCLIPAIKGPYRSKEPRAVLREAEELVADGAVELNLIAQDTTNYGRDLRPPATLPKLLRDLHRLDGLRWIRILYAHPAHVTGAFVAAMRDLPKVCPYLDIPIQHVSDPILRRMGRGQGRERLVALLDRLRREIPELVLRTAVIVGFPGEESHHFEELKAFLRDFRFERLGAFVYSHEEGTGAADLSAGVPEEEKERRFHEIMTLQQEIAFAWARGRVGREMDVLVEGRIVETGPDEMGPEGRGGEGITFWGRSCADAPEVDPIVHIRGESLRIGDIVPVRVVAGSGYDLVAAAAGGAE